MLPDLTDRDHECYLDHTGSAEFYRRSGISVLLTSQA